MRGKRAKRMAKINRLGHLRNHRSAAGRTPGPASGLLLRYFQRLRIVGTT